MRLLDRYLLRELLAPLAYCLGGFLTFYVAFDLIFGIKGFLEKHLGFADMAEYYVVTLPELLVMIVIPVSLLLALLYALTNHSRYQELTAMRTAGVGLWRLSLPYFGVAFLLGLVVLAMNELLVPPSEDRAREILHRYDSNPASRVWIPVNFHNEADGRTWQIDRFNRATSEMIAPKIIRDQADGFDPVHRRGSRHLHQRPVGFLQRGGLGAAAGAPADPNPPATQTRKAVVALTLTESPAWIESELKVSALALSPTEAAKKPQLSIREIRTYLRLHPHPAKQRREMLMTQLQCRLAAPFTCSGGGVDRAALRGGSGRQNVFAGVATALASASPISCCRKSAWAWAWAGSWRPFWRPGCRNIGVCLAGLGLMWRAR